MKFATLDNGTRDGELVVVDPSGRFYVSAREVAPTLQAALDRWDVCRPALQALNDSLRDSAESGTQLPSDRVLAPLPRAYEWIDGSAYINHIVLVRKARGAEPPETLKTDPLVYQGGSGVLLAPNADLELPDPDFGLDYEAEVCVVLGDTPRGVRAEDAGRYIRLVLLCNDVTYRNLIPSELKKGFGFFGSKPATAFSPLAVTPDELGDAWQGGRLHLPLHSSVNGEDTGHPDAGPEMHFSFFDLIEHITKTRAFTAGTILGSGTVSNEAEDKGVSCLAERRMREILAQGKASTAFLKVGDTVRIEAITPSGERPFGVIAQKVVAASSSPREE